MRPPTVRIPVPVVGSIVLAASLVAACIGGGTPAPTAAPSVAPSLPGSPSASAASSVEPAPSAIFTINPTVGPTAVASASRPPATPTVAPEPSPSGAFACAYPYERAASRTDPVALIRDVRVGAHDAYDRIVVEYLGTGVSRVRIERATPPFVKDPSGLPLTVAGSSFLRIVLLGASGAGYATANGQPSYTGATTFNAGYARLTSLVQAGDFEGVTTWYAGLTGPMCYAVSELGSPARLAIDLRAP